MSNADGVLIRADSVSKKFSKNLKLAMKYGFRDSIAESVRKRRAADKKTLRKGEFWALQDISFELKRGDRLGVLGGNGAGKSTLMKLCSGLLQPDAGRIQLNGSIDQMIEITSGFHPLMTGYENARFRARLKGMSEKDFQLALPGLLEFTELADFMDSPVRTYSSGMKARLGFAVATLRKPDILIIDEALAVGDLSFRLKCYEFIAGYMKETALLFVSHSLGHVRRFCNAGMVLDKGRCAFHGSVEDAIDTYEHSVSKGISTRKAELNADMCRFEFLAPTVEDGEITYRHGDTISIVIDIGDLEGVASAVLNMTDMHNRTFQEWQSELAGYRVAGNSENLVDLEACQLAAGYYQLNVSLFGEDGFTLRAYTAFKRFRVVGTASAGAPLVSAGGWKKFD